MKRTLSLVAALFTCGLLPGPVPALPPDAQPLDSIAAVVNDDVITATELEQEIDLVRTTLAQQRTALPPQQMLARQVLERMVLEKLQLQVAANTGIQVDDETLNQTLRRIASENQLSLIEFRRVLERDGYDFGQFREDIRQEIIIRRLHERQVQQRVIVTEQEVDRFMEEQSQAPDLDMEYRLGHILVAVPESATPDQIENARRKAEEIRGKLAGEGADFAELAVAYSEGQQALEGGDLGWRKGSELPTLFANQVPQMEVGDISPVIRSASGFHIIRLGDKRGNQHVVEQTRARHILLRPNEITSDEAVQEQLQKLRQRTLAGEDFAELARKYSEDMGSAQQGGSLGWINPGDTVPDFEEAMADLKPGEISQPFRSPFGWHIVQVRDRRATDNTQELEHKQARDALRQRRVNEETETWLRRLRDDAFVEYRIDQTD